jgi:hypothetical protein
MNEFLHPTGRVRQSGRGAGLAQGVNELLFPVGCALVVYAATILAKRIATGPTAHSQEPLSVSFATTGNQLQAS